MAEAEAEALERLAREGAEAGGGGGKPQQRRADAGNLWPTGSGPQDVPQVRCPTHLQWNVVSSHLAIGWAQGCEIWLFPPTAGWQAAWCGLGPNWRPTSRPFTLEVATSSQDRAPQSEAVCLACSTC